MLAIPCCWRLRLINFFALSANSSLCLSAPIMKGLLSNSAAVGLSVGFLVKHSFTN